LDEGVGVDKAASQEYGHCPPKNMFNKIFGGERVPPNKSKAHCSTHNK
jgi:hypothetical protein